MMRSFRQALLASLPFWLTAVAAAEPDDLRRLSDVVELQNQRISQLEQELNAKSRTRATPVSLGVFQDEDSGIQEQFKKMESEISDLSDAIDEVAKDKTIARSGTSRNTMVVNGRIHADMWGISDTGGATRSFEGVDSVGNPSGTLDPQNRLGFRRMRFGVKGNIDDNMRYKIEMEFAGGNDIHGIPSRIQRRVHIGQWDFGHRISHPRYEETIGMDLSMVEIEPEHWVAADPCCLEEEDWLKVSASVGTAPLVSGS